MAFLLKLGLFVAVTSISTTLALPKNSQIRRTESQEYNDPQTGSDPSTYELPSYLELPKENAPKVPFFSQEPSVSLQPPQYYDNPPINYDEVPIPSTDLSAPIETVWNPRQDPNYYFEIPAALTKHHLPTNEFPKKYNADVHGKRKPSSFKPKQIVELIPIEEKALQHKQNALDKTFNNLAKVENRKDLESLKAQQAV